MRQNELLSYGCVCHKAYVIPLGIYRVIYLSSFDMLRILNLEKIAHEKC